MAPNLTSTNDSLYISHNGADEPLDLTLHQKPETQFHPKERKFILSEKQQREVAENALLQQTDKSQTTQSTCQKLKNIRKQKIGVAKKWLKHWVSTDTTFTFYTILMAYTQFYSGRNEQPLETLDFLDLVRSELSEVSEETPNNDQTSDNQDEDDHLCVQSKLKNGGESVNKIKDQSSHEESLIPQFSPNLKFRKTFQDDHYDEDGGNSSDSGLESCDQESDYHHSEGSENGSSERDSSYESSDETNPVIKGEPKDESVTSIEFASDSDNGFIRKFKRSSISQNYGGKTVIAYAHSVDSYSGGESSRVSVKREFESDPKSDTDGSNLKKTKIISGENTAKRGKWSKTQEKVIEKVAHFLDLKEYETSPCYEDAKRLSQVFIEMLKNKQLQVFLTTFTHSMTCRERHPSLCFMFKRIIHHVTTSNHNCAVKRIYGHILRLHLDTCSSDNCGFPKCKNLREMRTASN